MDDLIISFSRPMIYRAANTVARPAAINNSQTMPPHSLHVGNKLFANKLVSSGDAR